MAGVPTITGRLRKEIMALGYPNVFYRTYRHLVDDFGNNPALTFGGFTSFFYIEIRPPFPFAWQVGGRWGPLPVGDGGAWGNAPFLWGFGGAAAAWHFEELRRTIAKWKPAGSSCRFVEIWLRTNIMGVPIEIRRVPVWEDWELDSNGAARDFYNNSFLVERV